MRIVDKSSKLPVHEVAPGLVGYRWIEVEADPGDSKSLSYRVTARIEAIDGRYTVVRLTAEQVDGGPPIQRGELAKISVEPFVRFAAQDLLRQRGSMLGAPAPSPEFWVRLEARGPADEEDLAELAHVYRWIRLQEPSQPNAILAKEFNKSRATINRWLARVVDAGHLDPSERS